MPPGLRENLERHIAGHRAAGRYDLDKAPRCADRHLSFEVCVGHDLELRRSSVKRYAGRARQVVSEDVDDLSNFAKVNLCRDKWTEAHRQAVDCATRTSTATESPIEEGGTEKT